MPHGVRSWGGRFEEADLSQFGDRRSCGPLWNAQGCGRLASLQLPESEHRRRQIDGARLHSQMNEQILVALLDPVESEHGLAEADLVEHDFHEPLRKLNEGSLRKIPAAIEVTTSRAVRGIHGHLVLLAAAEASRQAPRDRPQTASADASAEDHGVRHQPADPTVAVDERIDVVQPMMSGGNGDDPSNGIRIFERPEPIHKSVCLADLELVYSNTQRDRDTQLTEGSSCPSTSRSQRQEGRRRRQQRQSGIWCCHPFNVATQFHELRPNE
jgi:hypothetical protein